MKQKLKRNKTNKSSGSVIRTIFQQELKEFEGRFEAKIDTKLENLERRVDEKAKRYRDQILTSNDKIAKELETHRQEREVGNFQASELRNQVDDHEKRIKVLESS